MATKIVLKDVHTLLENSARRFKCGIFKIVGFFMVLALYFTSLLHSFWGEKNGVKESPIYNFVPIYIL
jgi:hypothetical protein